MFDRLEVELKNFDSEEIRFNVLKNNACDYGDYRTVSLRIHPVSMLSSFAPAEDRKKAVESIEAMLSTSKHWVEDTILHVADDYSGADYFTLDIDQYVQQGEIVELHFRAPNYFSFVIGSPEGISKSTAHFINSSDLRLDDEIQCPDHKVETGWRGTHKLEVKIQCQREEGHRGRHQSFADDIDRSWGKSMGGSTSWNAVFGVPAKCQHCGEVGINPYNEEPRCFTCNFWLEHHAFGEGIVVDGRHYRPGKGGFDGFKFKVEFFNPKNRGWESEFPDGARPVWEGELFTQGKIPERFLPLFPDNARFLEGFGA